MNVVNIRVEQEDVDMLMGRIKDNFIKENPEMEGMLISRRFMFKKIIQHVEEGLK